MRKGNKNNQEMITFSRVFLRVMKPIKLMAAVRIKKTNKQSNNRIHARFSKRKHLGGIGSFIVVYILFELKPFIMSYSGKGEL